MSCKIKTRSSSAGRIHLILPFLPYFFLLAFMHLTLSLNSWALILFLPFSIFTSLSLSFLWPSSVPCLPPLPNLLLCLCKSLSQLLPLPQQLWSLLVRVCFELSWHFIFAMCLQEALVGDRRSAVVEEGSQERCIIKSATTVGSQSSSLGRSSGWWRWAGLLTLCYETHLEVWLQSVGRLSPGVRSETLYFTQDPRW